MFPEDCLKLRHQLFAEFDQLIIVREKHCGRMTKDAAVFVE